MIDRYIRCLAAAVCLAWFGIAPVRAQDAKAAPLKVAAAQPVGAASAPARPRESPYLAAARAQHAAAAASATHPGISPLTDRHRHRMPGASRQKS
jgi:hypothetical protein